MGRQWVAQVARNQYDEAARGMAPSAKKFLLSLHDTGTQYPRRSGASRHTLCKRPFRHASHCRHLPSQRGGSSAEEMLSFCEIDAAVRDGNAVLDVRWIGQILIACFEIAFQHQAHD